MGLSGIGDALELEVLSTVINHLHALCTRIAFKDNQDEVDRNVFSM
jgi:hypothetical protein